MGKRKNLVIAIIGVIGLVLGSTLAWYTWVSTNTDVTFTIGESQSRMKQEVI